MNTLTASHIGLARAYGSQRADRDIASKTRLNDTDCAAYDAMNDASSKGVEIEFSGENIRAWQNAFEAGYNEAHAAREYMVSAPDYSLPGHIMRACYACRARFCRTLGTPDAASYRDAAVIICPTCIIRLAEQPVA